MFFGKTACIRVLIINIHRIQFPLKLISLQINFAQGMTKTLNIVDDMNTLIYIVHEVNTLMNLRTSSNFTFIAKLGFTGVNIIFFTYFAL